jgi:murein DD-endopeptidase MepM/ murein hydrolase activator NlpD
MSSVPQRNATRAQRCLMLLALAGSALISTAPAAQAGNQPPDGGFSLPAACTLGQDCWIMNYPDMDPSAAAHDPMCGLRTYDHHEGTDIAIRDVGAMRRGVPVLAAADGRVRNARDGMQDRFIDAAGIAALRGRDCGNGVLIEHGDGWQTQYCHMRRGSVAVKPGQTVRRGERLGLVGLSGRTAFPHVHITVRYDGVDLDPMTGRKIGSGCDARATGMTLWSQSAAARYSPGVLYAAGFGVGPVTSAALKDDASSPDMVPASAPALVLWATLFGVRAGDRVTIEIDGPDGRMLHRHIATVDRDQAWHMSYSGLRRPGASWPAGHYRGTATLHRDGPEALTQTRRVELDIR